MVATQPALNDVKVDWGVGFGTSSKKSGSIGAALGAKVMSLFSHGGSAAAIPELHQAPYNVPPIFSDEHFRIYAIFSASKLPGKVTVDAKSPDGTLSVQ